MNAMRIGHSRATLTADATRQLIAYATSELERLESEGEEVTQAVVAALVDELLPLYLRSAQSSGPCEAP